MLAALVTAPTGGAERARHEGADVARRRRDVPGAAVREVDPGLSPGEPGRRHHLRGGGQQRGPAALSAPMPSISAPATQRSATSRWPGCRPAPGWCRSPRASSCSATTSPGSAGPLRLSRDVSVDIFAGRIRTWNDPRIRAVNPGVDLPNRSIARGRPPGRQRDHLRPHQPLQRGERGLARPRAGRGKSRRLARHGDAGARQRGRGRPGSRAASIRSATSSTTSPAVSAWPWPSLQNRAGQYVEPGERSGQMALAANVKQMPTNLRLFLPDPEGAESYPIVTFSWFCSTPATRRPTRPPP